MFLEHGYPNRVLQLSYISHVLFNGFFIISRVLTLYSGSYPNLRTLAIFDTREGGLFTFAGWSFDAHFFSVCLGVEVL